ncbi:hypothetical protein G7K_3135-t1 [Saitoella complicata NRRL Y-17804]|uniref:Zn(2)-C6 fungal-type domain-containing protein n=1 Tax=Saitoella complicata (strain BCRC 22490 / CBS 7301 / JCM 7358 / NBRC 10748 / NRRL Y-17804) TaxID=698492 RepID=A0A0E9NGL2_SAICN|nr:hypothetical protein G7K_3135-t1 [Saitoella complicata NRRL Y-17804]
MVPVISNFRMASHAEPAINAPSVTPTPTSGLATTIAESPWPGGVIRQRTRISHACDACKERKRRCSGERPVCVHCRCYGLNCVYSSRRRDGHQGELAALRDEREMLTDMMVRALPTVSDPTLQEAMQKVLDTNRRSAAQATSIPKEEPSSDLPREYPGPDYTEEELLYDLNTIRITHPEGYLGPSHPTAILKPLANEVVPDYERTVGHLLGFGTDDLKNAEWLDLSVDPLELPSRQDADELVTIYFSHLHCLYPILWRPRFVYEYMRFWDNNKRVVFSNNNNWLAILNMVFCIGSLYAMAMVDNPDQNGPLIYFKRAQSLSMNMFSIGNLETVQCYLFMAWFLHAMGMNNRAYTLLGTVVRMAEALGLHIKSSRSGIDPILLETRRRVWHGIIVFERTLELLLGRPISSPGRFSNVELPVEVDEEWFEGPQSLRGVGQPNFKPTRVAYLIEAYKLSKITEQVVDKLYSAVASAVPWSLYEVSVADLGNQTLTWKSLLPFHLRFEDQFCTGDPDGIYIRQRNALALRYHNVRMMIFRRSINTALARGKDAQDQHDYVRTRPKLDMTDFALRECTNEAMQVCLMFHDTRVRTKQMFLEQAWWEARPTIITAASILALVYRACTQGNVNLDGDTITKGKIRECLEYLKDAVEALILDSLLCSERTKGIVLCLIRLADGDTNALFDYNQISMTTPSDTDSSGAETDSWSKTFEISQSSEVNLFDVRAGIDYGVGMNVQNMPTNQAQRSSPADYRWVDQEVGLEQRSYGEGMPQWTTMLAVEGERQVATPSSERRGAPSSAFTADKFGLPMLYDNPVWTVHQHSQSQGSGGGPQGQ